MNKETVTIKTLLSEQTVKKLNAALDKGNTEDLKKRLEKLFTFKNVFNMHDDHLIEMAETIVDIAKAKNQVEYAQFVEQYAQSRMARHQKRKKKLILENQWAHASKNMDEMSMMDLKYKLWVYESGFEYSKFHMYAMLCEIAKEVQRNEKDNT